MLRTVLRSEYRRLGKPVEFNTFRNRWAAACRMAARVESRNDPQALSIIDNKKGLYQFSDVDFRIAKNRLREYLTLPDTPTIFLLNKEQQTALFVANLCKQKRADELIISLIKNINKVENIKNLHKIHNGKPSRGVITAIKNYF